MKNDSDYIKPQVLFSIYMIVIEQNDIIYKLI